MAREINCGGCGCKVGEVRDASLMKSIAYYCGKCDGNIKALLKQKSDEASAKAANDYLKQVRHQSPFGNMFGDMFSGKKPFG